MKYLLDFIYPTFCIHCSHKIEFNRVLCSACSEYLIIEMDDTIKHVLEDNPISSTYLSFVKKHLAKSHIQTLAAFTTIKYYRIFKSKPTLIFASKNQLASLIAKQLSKNLKIPLKKSIKFFNKRDLTEEIIIYFNNGLNHLKII